MNCRLPGHGPENDRGHRVDRRRQDLRRRSEHRPRHQAQAEDHRRVGQGGLPGVRDRQRQRYGRRVVAAVVFAYVTSPPLDPYY